MDIRERRTALGLNRQQLAARAQVDKSVLQLLELGLSHDDESLARVTKALDEAESAGGKAPSEETPPGS